MSELLRKGRLGSVRRDVTEFTSSVECDKKIQRHVVNINKAHMIMLIERGIVNQNDGGKILGALANLDRGVTMSPEVEDVHMAVEEEVTKAVGEDVGGNLNIAKSRNDQVATAIRMNLREELLGLIRTVLNFQKALIQRSDGSLEVIIPGYTHLQPAQPVTFAHYLLAQYDAFQRNLQRFEEAYSRVNLCPMGAAALATTSFPISRERVADLLGFDGVLENSLDAVSSRDFLLEVLADLSIMAVDATRFVEDIIVWSTTEFGTIELPDEFAFTSSIMPQKKNPDILEVIRARMSLTLGDFAASSMVLKALPSAYNMDFQEVTPKLWGAMETAKDCLTMLTEIISSLKVKPSVLNKPALSFLASTELANKLVQRYKVPFRTAHMTVGALVRVLTEDGKSLKDATPDLLAEASQKFMDPPLKVRKEDIQDAVEPSNLVRSHKAQGGPSPVSVRKMLRKRRQLLALSEKWISEEKLRLEESEKLLSSQVASHLSPIREITSDHKV